LVVLIAIMAFFYVSTSTLLPSVSGTFFGLMLLGFFVLVVFLFLGGGGRARALF
jgi:membrane protein required for beta-lactamase induction